MGKNNKNNNRALLEIFSMMNRPIEFFQANLSTLRGMLYFLAANFIFTSMTQTLVFYELIPATLETTFEMSIVINFFSIIIGLFLICAALIFINVLMGGKKHEQLFAVVLYSIVPSLLFIWIPFIFIQFIVLFWSLALIMIGVKNKENFTYKKALVYPIIFIVLLGAITIISQNFIFLGFLK